MMPRLHRGRRRRPRSQHVVGGGAVATDDLHDRAGPGMARVRAIAPGRLDHHDLDHVPADGAACGGDRAGHDHGHVGRHRAGWRGAVARRRRPASSAARRLAVQGGGEADEGARGRPARELVELVPLCAPPGHGQGCRRRQCSRDAPVTQDKGANAQVAVRDRRGGDRWHADRRGGGRWRADRRGGGRWRASGRDGRRCRCRGCGRRRRCVRCTARRRRRHGGRRCGGGGLHWRAGRCWR